MKKTETLFTNKGQSDSKCKLNRLNQRVNNSILEQIENGITLEQLDNISNKGIPVFRYHTQITIHGLFSDLSNNYIFGYKNIFQNKNKSIGIKYNAIDEDKRQRIAERLHLLGFYYRRNSTETKFSIVTRITEDNFEAVKNELFSLFQKIDKGLYYGSSFIYSPSDGWNKYLCLDLYINAIYEKNIEAFLNKLGATKEALQEYNDKKEAEQKEREQKYQTEREAEKKERQKILENTDLGQLEKFTHVTKTSEPGLYLLKSFNYNNELEFKIVYIYTVKGKKKPRVNRESYKDLNEALKYKPIEGWNDSIYNGRVTGYRIG